MATDLLDVLLGQIEADGEDVAFLKSGDDYLVVKSADLETDYGDLVEIERRKAGLSEKEVPVFEQKVTDAEKKAQEDRSKKYGIGVKSNGSATMPKKWADAGVKESEFGDPVNYKLPLHDKDHAQNALGRVQQEAFTKAYTSDELAIIEKRVKDAAKGFGIEVSDEGKTKGAEGDNVLRLGGFTFSFEDKNDGLGRPMRFFTVDGASGDLETQGFVRNGEVAFIKYSPGTEQEKIREMIQVLGFQKNAVPREKQGGESAFAAALEDAMDSLSMQALSGAWYAFCSCIQEGYSYSIDEDIAPEDFNTYADQLAQALKNIFAKYGDVADVITLAIDAQRTIRRGMVRTGEQSEKAGARLSKRDREKIEGIIETLTEYVGVKNDEKSEGKKSTSGSTRPPESLAELHSELMRVKESQGTELKRVQVDQEKLAQENRGLREKLAEKDELLERLGKQPLPDPLKDGRTQEIERKTSGGTVYDMVDPSDVF